MASNTPEIQAEALLNLVLDEASLKQQLTKALGTTIKEAASSAQLGNELASPKNLQALRKNLERTFKDAGKDLGEALNLAQSDSLKGVLDKTRRDTVKKFQRDIDDLLSGKGRSATRSLPALPQLGKEVQDELRSAMRVFGREAIRSGSYQQRGPQIMQAQRNVADINKVLKELAGIPAVAAKDLQKIRSLVNDKDTGRYLKMQAAERNNLTKSAQALQLQTQNLNRLATTLSKMGFGDLASDIKAANQARKDLVSQFTRLSSPQAVEGRAAKEARDQAKIDRQLETQRRRALRNEISQREAERKAQGTYQTVLGRRRAGQIGPGLAATMDDATRARLGLKPREDMRQASLANLAPTAEQRRLNAWFNRERGASPLEQIQQNVRRAQAGRLGKQQLDRENELRNYNEQIRKAGDQQLVLREKARKKQEDELSSYNEQIRKAGDQQLVLREKARKKQEDELSSYNEQIRKAGDQQLVLREKARKTQEDELKKQEDQLRGYNEQIRKAGDHQLALMENFRKQQEKLQDSRSASQRQAEEQQRRDQVRYGTRTASYGDAQRILGMVGGIGGLRDDLDIGIVRGGLSNAYRQAQARLGVANTVHGQDSPQYRDALAELGRIRSERDMLAERIRAVRAERRGAGGPGGGGGGRGGEGREYSAAGNLLGTFSRYAIGYGGLYQVLNLVTQLKTEIVELDRAFYSIKAVTQATDIEMKSISRSIREVAMNTNFSTREIAAATELLGQAGVAPADMDKVLSSTARFASATNSSLSVAADLLTTVRTVFKELEEATIADQLTKAINLSKLSAEDLKTILSLTSQTAASYNINLEQMLAAVTTLRNAGVKPSTVATGLRQAMLEIFNPDTATLKALGKRYADMGEKMDTSQIQQRFFGFTNAQNPLLAALTELRRLGFNDEGQKTLQRGVDIRAFNAIQGLLSNFKELEEAESRITFGQAAAEGAEIQMQSLAASLENLGASIVVLAEQMSNGLVRQLANGAKEATNLIEKLSDLDLQLRATGAGSLNEVFGGALAGGVAGAVSGKGFRGKVLGSLVGATAGGYLSGGYKFDQEGEFGVGDAAGIAATLLLLGKAMKWIAEIGKAVAPIASTVGAAGGASAAGAGAATAAKTIGARFIPFVGWALTAISVISTIADLIPESEASKMKAQAEAASAQAAKVRQKLQANTELVNAFDPNAENPEPGTASAGFAKYQENLENFRLSLETTFGQMTDAQAKQVTDLVQQYASQTFTQRTNSGIEARLQEILGRPISEEVTDQVLFGLGQQREALEATVSAYVDNTRQLITSVTERIRAARETGGEIAAKDLAMSQAFSENADELQAILDGTSGLSPEETQERLKEFYARFVELVDQRPALAAEERAKNIDALANQLAAALANSNNQAEISQAVSQIGNSLEFISLTTKDRLAGILAGLNQASVSIDQQIKDLEGQRPDILHRGTNAVWRFLGAPNEVGEKAEADWQGQMNKLLQTRSQLAKQTEAAIQRDYDLEMAQLQANKKAREDAERNANALLDGFNDADIRAALDNPQTLRDVGLNPQQIKLLQSNAPGLANRDPALLQRLSATTKDEKGNVVTSPEFQDLDKAFSLLSSNLNKVTEAQLRRERDEKNLISIDQLRRKTEAETAIKKADYGKDYGLLASDTPNNPVVQLFAAQREILEKELAQAKAKAEDAAEDGSKTAVARQQAVLEAQAKLDTLDLEKQQELAKYQAKLKTAGEQAQRKADTEAKKQARIGVTQTGIEQRIVKQNFDEAVRTGDIVKFQELSDQYLQVQEKLRTQLEEELKARGYTTSQILDEIKLRQDLNKPLAEQVENIRKLADQRAQLRDLNYRDIGTGPDLGGKEQTAYLGFDGFTQEELIGAGIRDFAALNMRRQETMADLNNAVFRQDEETVRKLEQELDDLDTQIGETRASLERMSATASESIYKAFSPRNLIIELENSQYTFQNLGDNLRSGLVDALDQAGDALARLVTEGGDFKDVMQQILHDIATQELGMMFKTNLREGLSGLIEGATGKDGGGGGFGGVLGAISSGLGNLFGFGKASAGAGSSAPAEQAAQAGGVLGTVASALGVGGGQTTAAMNVQAGVVNVIGGEGVAGLTEGITNTLGKTVPDAVGKGVQAESKGFFASIGDGIGSLFSGFTSLFSGLFGGGGGGEGGAGGGFGGLFSNLGGLFGGGKTGADVGAAANQYGPEVAKMGGNVGAAASSGGGWAGAAGGAGIGMGLGAALGGLIDKKNGSKWGAILGGLAGAYFGFGMAGGGHITKSGMVVGSGQRGVDSVPVSVRGTRQHGLLAPGEGVLNVSAMDALGPGWLDAANSGQLFRKAVGGVIGASYNATERAQASARNSVAMASGGGSQAPVVNLKNVNITDQSQVFAAMQTREGEDLMINRLKARGALGSNT